MVSALDILRMMAHINAHASKRKRLTKPKVTRAQRKAARQRQRASRRYNLRTGA
jgi:hypothetical protein